MMQQLAALIAGLITATALLSNILAAAPSISGQQDAGSSDGLPPPPTTQPAHLPLVVNSGTGVLVVNGISFGLTLWAIHHDNPEFPAQGHPVYTETGRELTQFDYRRAGYQFDGQKLVRIVVDQTPEGFAAGTPLSQVVDRLGEPVHLYASTTGRGYAVYPVAATTDTAWIFEYSAPVILKNGQQVPAKVTRIILCQCLKQMLADARKAREHKS